MYDDFKCKILHEGKFTDCVEITNGVRQGCILSPIIFFACTGECDEKDIGRQEERNTVGDER
jgi:hypothetical protein